MNRCAAVSCYSRDLIHKIKEKGKMSQGFIYYKPYMYISRSFSFYQTIEHQEIKKVGSQSIHQHLCCKNGKPKQIPIKWKIRTKKLVRLFQNIST